LKPFFFLTAAFTCLCCYLAFSYVACCIEEFLRRKDTRERKDEEMMSFWGGRRHADFALSNERDDLVDAEL